MEDAWKDQEQSCALTDIELADARQECVRLQRQPDPNFFQLDPTRARREAPNKKLKEALNTGEFWKWIFMEEMGAMPDLEGYLAWRRRTFRGSATACAPFLDESTAISSKAIQAPPVDFKPDEDYHRQIAPQDGRDSTTEVSVYPKERLNPHAFIMAETEGHRDISQLNQLRSREFTLARMTRPHGSGHGSTYACTFVGKITAESLHLLERPKSLEAAPDTPTTGSDVEAFMPVRDVETKRKFNKNKLGNHKNNMSVSSLSDDESPVHESVVDSMG